MTERINSAVTALFSDSSLLAKQKTKLACFCMHYCETKAFGRKAYEKNWTVREFEKFSLALQRVMPGLSHCSFWQKEVKTEVGLVSAFLKYFYGVLLKKRTHKEEITLQSNTPKKDWQTTIDNLPKKFQTKLPTTTKEWRAFVKNTKKKTKINYFEVVGNVQHMKLFEGYEKPKCKTTLFPVKEHFETYQKQEIEKEKFVLFTKTFARPKKYEQQLLPKNKIVVVNKTQCK